MSADEAIAFLTMPWPGLLGWVCDPDAIEANLDHGECKASYRVGRDDDLGWAWAVWKDGLHYERGDTWIRGGGWSLRPRHVIKWTDLHALLDRHAAQVGQVKALAAGRGRPRGLGWRWFTDPYIISTPGAHPSNLEAERSDAYYDLIDEPGRPHGYADRLNAWLICTQIAAQLWIEPNDLIEWAEALE